MLKLFIDNSKLQIIASLLNKYSRLISEITGVERSL